MAAKYRSVDSCETVPWDGRLVLLFWHLLAAPAWLAGPLPPLTAVVDSLTAATAPNPRHRLHFLTRASSGPLSMFSAGLLQLATNQLLPSTSRNCQAVSSCLCCFHLCSLGRRFPPSTLPPRRLFGQFKAAYYGPHRPSLETASLDHLGFPPSGLHSGQGCFPAGLCHGHPAFAC